jgi:hypothetical protein
MAKTLYDTQISKCCIKKKNLKIITKTFINLVSISKYKNEYRYNPMWWFCGKIFNKITNLWWTTANNIWKITKSTKAASFKLKTKIKL